MSRKKFSKEFKLAAVRRIQAGEPMPYLPRVLEVNPSDLYRWHRESQQLGEGAFVGAGQRQAEQDRSAELERKIGQQALEIDFFAASLAACRGAAPAAGRLYRSGGKSKRERG